jgi:hypothetical protein
MPRKEKIDTNCVIKNQTHCYNLSYLRFTFDVPNAEQGYPVWLSLSNVGICKKRGIILISNAC